MNVGGGGVKARGAVQVTQSSCCLYLTHSTLCRHEYFVWSFTGILKAAAADAELDLTVDPNARQGAGRAGNGLTSTLIGALSRVEQAVGLWAHRLHGVLECSASWAQTWLQ
jgi:hypothetical protein